MNVNRKSAAVLIAAWFAAVFAASALGFYRDEAFRPGIAVGASALAPVLAFAFWYAGSSGFRRFVLSLDPRTLTLLHLWRLAGVTFVILEAHGKLPAMFALPAGYGDMAVGATASLAAFALARPERRALFLAWQWLGIADLVIAVSLGTTARVFGAGAASMSPMTSLPLSLVPTFIVPLLLVVHLICIAQAHGWKEAAIAGGARA